MLEKVLCRHFKGQVILFFAIMLLVYAPGSALFSQSYQFVTMAPNAVDPGIKGVNSVAMDSDSNLYLADPSMRAIHIYDKTGSRSGIINSVDLATGSVEFNKPEIIYIDKNDNLYIGDNGHGKVIVRPQTDKGYTMGVNGSSLGQIDRINGIAVDGNGYVYILNGRRKQVDIFTPQGDYLTWIAGGVTAFSDPISIGINGNNEIYVLDADGPSVLIFDVFGNLVRSFGQLADRPGVAVSKPLAMAVFQNGDFFILDRSSSQVTQFNREGNVIGTIGSKGSSGRGTFEKPTSVASGTGYQTGLAILDSKVNAAQLFNVSTSETEITSELERLRLVPLRNLGPAVLDLAVAPNGTRYIVPATERNKLIALGDTSAVPIFEVRYNMEAVSVACDKDNNAFVVDRRGKEVIMFDQKGVLIRKFGTEIPDKLKDPTSIAILNDGTVLVVDYGNGIIQKWNNQGVYQGILTSILVSNLESPYKMRLDSRDQIYVWDDKINAILRFSADGKQNNPLRLRARGEKPGTFGQIGGFFIDPLDQIHIFNLTTKEFELFTWVDTPERLFNIGHPSTGLYSMNGVELVALDPSSFQIFVSDARGQVQKAYQYVIKPPMPENLYSFEVEGRALSITVNPVDDKSVVGYGLLTATSSGEDSLAYRSKEPKFLIDESEISEPRLKRYKLVTLSLTDKSDPTEGFDNFFGYGNQLFKAGQFEEGLNAYRNALKFMGGTRDMANFVSRQLMLAGLQYGSAYDLNNALRYLRSSYQLSPTQKDILEGLAQGYNVVFWQLAMQEDFDLIMGESQRLVESEPMKPIILSSLDSISNALIKLPSESSINNAMIIQKKMVEWDPGNPSYYESLAQTQFELFKLKRSKGAPGYELDIILNEAEKYSNQAVQGLREKQLPFYKTELLYLEILNLSRKYAVSEQIAQRTITTYSALIPKDLTIRYRTQLANAYNGQGKYDLAVVEYQNLSALEPSNLETKMAFADALIAVKKYDDAKGLYQQLLFEDRENIKYISKIGQIELLKGNFNEASFQLEKAVNLEPANRALYGPLAEAFDGASNFQKALDNYRIAIQYLEEHLALTQDNLSNTIEIEQDRQTLVKYLVNVARLHEQIGNFDQSIEAYNKVIATNTSNAEAWYGLGTASLSAGLVYDAVKALSTARRLAPGNELYANAHFNAMNLRDQLSRNEPPLNIVEIRIKEVFPSLYRNYADLSLLPVGEVVISNNVSIPISPSNLSVFISGLMDQPTHQRVGALVGYSNSSVKLSAIFSEAILDISEDKKLQAEVELVYNHEGKPRTIKKSVPITVHGRNAISWADKRRLASFVSPNVTEIIDYNRKMDQIFSNTNSYGLNKTILKAFQIYTLLHHNKIIYSPDPEQSFALVTTNTEILDFLQYPTETLVRKSGDCDDLVALFCSLLENAGISTAYVDVPGHVFMAFDAQIPPNSIGGSGLEETEVVVLYDKVWIPIETTLIGTQPFLTSWKTAAGRYYKELATRNFPEIVPLSDARKVYLPSNYTPGGFKSEPTLTAGALEQYNMQVSELFAKTRKEILNELEARYKTEPQNVFVKNKYALLLIQMGDTVNAEKALLEAFELSPGSASVLNNLGNIYYFRDDFDKAIEFYSKAAELDTKDGEIFINLTRAWMKKGDNNKAKMWFQQALKTDPEMASLYEFLIKELQ